MYLLDTNHCSLIILKEPIIMAHIERVGEANIATSIISAGELIYMAENSRNPAENLALIQEFLSDIRVYYIHDKTCLLYTSDAADE